MRVVGGGEENGEWTHMVYQVSICAVEEVNSGDAVENARCRFS